MEYGGDVFEKFKDDLNDFQPHSDLKLEPQQTKLYPLPAWNIDESSVVGNIEVIQAITDELELQKHPEFNNRARILAGDQLSIARLRSIETLRAGHEADYEGYFWGIHILGLFHTKIADILGLLLTHFGKPNAGTTNPGSLAFHNTCLDRLPITITSPPSFRVCRDLVFTSLYGRVLYCLLLVSQCDSLAEYMTKFGTWEALVDHATEIFQRYANADIVENLRHERLVSTHPDPDDPEQQPKKSTKGDMVFENAVLFMRDALISREFSDAVKAIDPGCILLVLKTFALSFRGTGRLKYAYEMLFFVHHVSHIWSPGVR